MADSVKKTKEPKKVIDISAPSATPTSRPIIVSHGPVMRDPTLAPSADTNPDMEPKTDLQTVSTHEVKIVPSKEVEDELKNEPVKEAQTEAKVEDSADKEEDTKQDQDAIKVEVKTKPPKNSEQPQPETGNTDTNDQPAANEIKEDQNTDNIIEEPTAEKSKIDADAELQKQELAAQEAKAVHDAQIDQMVDEEKYFLPVNRMEQRRQHFVIIGAIIAILLAVAWLDIALDAGLLHNNYNLPHTHFFSLKS